MRDLWIDLDIINFFCSHYSLFYVDRHLAAFSHVNFLSCSLLAMFEVCFFAVVCCLLSSFTAHFPSQYTLALRCTVLYCTMLLCTVLYYAVLYCTVLYCTVLYCTVLYCTVLYYAALCCTLLRCTVLYCTLAYSTTVFVVILFCTKAHVSSSAAFRRSQICSMVRTGNMRMRKLLRDRLKE